MTPPGGPAPHRWGAAWSAALDDLELELDRAERLLHSGHFDGPPTSWQPPALPPLPPELADRARAIHDRQLRVAAAMTRRLSDLSRQQAVVDRVHALSRDSRAYYVDRAV